MLHVDDEPAITRIIDQRLSAYGIAVTAVNDPKLVCDLLLREQYQVVLLDVDMQEIDGLELLESIKRLDGGMGVVMVTGAVSLTNVLRAMRLGAATCFFKPLDDIRPLAEAIRREFTKIDTTII